MIGNLIKKLEASHQSDTNRRTPRRHKSRSGCSFYKPKSAEDIRKPPGEAGEKPGTDPCLVGISPTDNLTLDFETPEFWDSTYLLFKVVVFSLWHFVKAALASYYNHQCQTPRCQVCWQGTLWAHVAHQHHKGRSHILQGVNRINPHTSDL